MSIYKLYYLNGLGRAEVARLILAPANQQFEDIRFERDQWPSYKTQMPLGQVPVLEVDGDLLVAITPAYREKDATKKKELYNKFLTEDLPKHLQNLGILCKLYSNGGSFFVGNQLTWVDLLFYASTESILKLDESSLDKHP